MAVNSAPNLSKHRGIRLVVLSKTMNMFIGTTGTRSGCLPNAIQECSTQHHTYRPIVASPLNDYPFYFVFWRTSVRTSVWDRTS